MRKLNVLLLSIVSVFVFLSCDDGNVGPVINENPNNPTFISPQPGTNYQLLKESANDTLLTFKWKEPNYGFPAATSFIIEMGMVGNNFAEPVEIGSTTKTSYSVTAESMNNTLLSAGLPFGQSSTVEFRVVASVDDSLSSQISKPISLTFTPYEVVITYPEIYVTGSFQAASGYSTNWEPKMAPALYSTESNDKYVGYVYMAEPNNTFKFTAERNWDNGDWGDDGADGTLDPGGANIALGQAGYYKMNVNLNTLTYQIKKTDWGIIGSATPNGWDADTDMTYHPDTKVWTVTLPLTTGEIKFRANDGWDISYGDKNGDGHLDQKDGNNISIDESGTYKITLNLSSVPYSYTLTKK